MASRSGATSGGARGGRSAHAQDASRAQSGAVVPYGGNSNKEKEVTPSGTNDIAFRLDSAFVEKLKIRVGENDWKSHGEVELPAREGFTKIVVGGENGDPLIEGIKYLGLNGNPVASMEGAEKLEGVVSVNCSACRLESVPGWIGGLPAIQCVFLGDNEISQLPSSFMESVVRRLTVLDISHCGLQTIPDDLFHHGLEIVGMVGNKGERIDS